MSRNNGCLIAVAVWLAMAGCTFGQGAIPALVALSVLAADAGENIERWVYGGRKAAEGRMRLEAALARNVQHIDDRYGLTPTQRKKLELAGRRDLKRFYDRIEAIKSEYRQTGGNFNGGAPPEVFELQKLQEQPDLALFGEGSMLAKTLRHTLTPAQVAYHEKKNYRARVEWAVGLLHSRLVLDAEQRSKLVNLIVEKTPPLKRYGDFDYDAIMFQLSRVPAETLRSVLDEGQCHAMKLRFEQARRMESILVSEGYIAPPKSSAARPQLEEARR